MKGSRFLRVLFGVFVLVVFGVYSFLKVSTSPHSSDFDSENAYIYSEVMEEIAAAEAAGVEYVPEHERIAREQAAAEAEAAAQAAAEAEAAAKAESELKALEQWKALGLPEVDLNSWEFILVNADNLLSAEFAPPEIAKIGDNQCPVDSRIAAALNAFAEAARAQGLPVYLSSGYRAYSEQEYLYNRKVSQGYSPEEAARIVAYPGSSEHQTGLCCDITDYYRETKSWQTLENTATYQWMSQHCHEYGFIVRYPKEKSGLDTAAAAGSVTGIIYEPWHYRYVGVEAATYIMENGLCLEEFIELIKNNPRPDVPEVPAPAITQDPQAVTAVAGSSIGFRVVASGDYLSYQWQVCKPGTDSWINSGAKGSDSPTLTVGVDAEMHGYQYRCAVTNISGTVFSEPALLTVGLA